MALRRRSLRGSSIPPYVSTTQGSTGRLKDAETTEALERSLLSDNSTTAVVATNETATEPHQAGDSLVALGTASKSQNKVDASKLIETLDTGPIDPSQINATMIALNATLADEFATVSLANATNVPAMESPTNSANAMVGPSESPSTQSSEAPSVTEPDNASNPSNEQIGSGQVVGKASSGSSLELGDDGQPKMTPQPTPAPTTAPHGVTQAPVSGASVQPEDQKQPQDQDDSVSVGVSCKAANGLFGKTACRMGVSVHNHPLAFGVLVVVLFYVCYRRCRGWCCRRQDERGEYRALAARDVLFEGTFDDDYSSYGGSMGSYDDDDVEEDDWSKGPKDGIEMSSIRQEVNGGLTLEEMNG